MLSRADILREGIYKPLQTLITRQIGVGEQRPALAVQQTTQAIDPAAKVDVTLRQDNNNAFRSADSQGLFNALLIAKSAQTGLEQLIAKVEEMKTVARRATESPSTAQNRFFFGLELADMLRDYNRIATSAGEDLAKSLDGSLANPYQVERLGDETPSAGFGLFVLGGLSRPFGAGDQFRIQIGKGSELVYTGTQNLFPALPTAPRDADADGIPDNPADEIARTDAANSFLQAISSAGSGFSTQSGGVVAFDGSTLSPGVGYVDSSYFSVPLSGGSGSGAQADIVVTGGKVSQVSIVPPGGDAYAKGDTLTASAGSLGVNGSGFSIKVAEVFKSINTMNPPLAAGFPFITADTLLFASDDFQKGLRLRSFLTPNSDAETGTSTLNVDSSGVPVRLRSLADVRIRPLEIGANAIMSLDSGIQRGSGYLGGIDASGVEVRFTGGSGRSASGTVDLSGGAVSRLQLRVAGVGFSAGDRLSIAFDDQGAFGYLADATTNASGEITLSSPSQQGTNYLGGGSATGLPVMIFSLSDPTSQEARGFATVAAGAITALSVDPANNSIGASNANQTVPVSVRTAPDALAAGSGFNVTVAEVGEANYSTDAFVYDMVFRSIDAVTGPVRFSNLNSAVSSQTPSVGDFSRVLNALEELTPVLARQALRAKMSVQAIETRARLFPAEDRTTLDAASVASSIATRNEGLAVKLSRMLLRTELPSDPAIAIVKSVQTTRATENLRPTGSVATTVAVISKL